LDAVVQMDVEYGELLRRISGRRTCTDCGRVFNLFSTPAEQIEHEKCPKTGEPHKLFQRPDDTEETVANRLKVYEEKTKPLIEFYRGKGLLQSINAEGDVDEITQRLQSALQAAVSASARDTGATSDKPAARKGAAAKKRAAASKRDAAKGRAVVAKPAAKRRVATAPKTRRKAAARKKATSAGKSKRAAVRRVPAKKAAKRLGKGPARRPAAKRAAGKSSSRRARR